MDSSLRARLVGLLTRRTALTIAGLAMLLVWGLAWGTSIHRGRLVGSTRVWICAWDFLGLDFLNNYQASRHWLAGGDPYREPFGDPLARKFCYPPVVLPLFAWCGWFRPQAAVVLWMGVLAGLAALGTMQACRARRQLGLWKVPLPLALAAVLGSTPVIFAMERGNYDLLVLAPLALAAWALQRRGLACDLLAGSCVALAAWMKVYPGLLGLGFIVLRRPRALGFCVLAGIAIGLPGLRDLAAFQANAKDLVVRYIPPVFFQFTHSLSADWPLLWAGTRLAWLARVPGLVVAGGFILLLSAWASYRLYRCPDSSRLLYPYFVWLTALATFLPEISNDYNFVFLPLAAVAVWDRRDPVHVHMSMALMLLWWQPVQLSIGPQLLFGFKLCGFAAVTACLLRRIQEQAEAVRCLEMPRQEGPPVLTVAA